jgi:RNA polymerase sigma-70 factor (ECF subfamily)
VKEETLASGALLISRTTDDAFEAAVRDYARMVFRIAFSVLHNHHDAEDATQETLMRVLRYRRKLEMSVREPRTWIARIAWRVAVERSQRQPEISLSDAETSRAASELRAQLVSAEESSLGTEMKLLLESLIAALPDQLRDVLRLSALDELTPKEIAQVLGTTEASVRSRVFRARQIVKEKLARLAGGYGPRG